MTRGLWLLLSGFTIAATGLSLLRSKRSWIRIWDFPRLQVAILGTIALAMGVTQQRRRAPGADNHHDGFGAENARVTNRPRKTAPAARASSIDEWAKPLLAAATAYQWSRVWRYTWIAPRETLDARAPADRISILGANVMQSNRAFERLARVVQETDPDVVLCAETDAWWCERLMQLAGEYPNIVRVPLDNTYGMMLMSRLPMSGQRVDFLVQDDVPSIRANVQLRGGAWVDLNCLHPRPPAPDKSDESLPRDSELLLVGQRVRNSPLPVIVCGDLNDVAWSHTADLFQKTGDLLDPRKGRGFYSTFNAFWPGLRFPLDHFYHSREFRLVDLRVLASIGSDHFPIYIEFSHEPSGAGDQEAPEPDQGDREEARETIAEGLASEGANPPNGGH